MVRVMYDSPRWYHTYSTECILNGVPESGGYIDWDVERKQDGNVCASLLAMPNQAGYVHVYGGQTQVGVLVCLLARRNTIRVIIDRHSLIWSVSMLTSKRSIVAVERVPRTQPLRNGASGLEVQRQKLR